MQLEFLQALQNLRTPWLTSFFEIITSIGAPQVYIVLLPLIFWCVSTRHGYRCLIVVLLSVYLNSLLKEVAPLFLSADQGPLYALRPYRAFPQQIWTCRSDPAFNPDALLSTLCREEETLAFPSGHAQTSMVAWGYLLVVLRRRSIMILGAAMIVLIGLSRLYLGQHWPTDVLGGWLIGAGVLATALWLFRRSSRPRLVNRVLLALMLLAVPVLTLLDPDPTYNRARALGLIAGVSIGYALQLQAAPFFVQARWPVQIGKILIGVIGIVALQLGLGAILPDARLIIVFVGTLTGVWVTYGAPQIFRAAFGERSGVPRAVASEEVAD